MKIVKLTKEMESRIIELNNLGWTHNAIANDIGTHCSTIGRALKRLGVKSFRTQITPAPLDMSRLLKLSMDGLSIREISRQLGVLPSRVKSARTVLREQGHVLPKLMNDTYRSHRIERDQFPHIIKPMNYRGRVFEDVKFVSKK